MDNTSRNLYIEIETVGALSSTDSELLKAGKLRSFKLPKTTLSIQYNNELIHTDSIGGGKPHITRLRTYLTQLLRPFNGKVNMSRVLLDFRKFKTEFDKFDMYSDEHSYTDYALLKNKLKITELIFINKIERVSYAYISNNNIQSESSLPSD